MSQNRITSTTVAETGIRQTPRNEFGEVFAKTGLEVARAGAGLMGVVGSVATGSPVVTAAVSSLQNFLSTASTNQSTTPLPGGGGITGGGATAGGQSAGTGLGDAQEAYRLQSALNSESFKLNTLYMDLQREMQRESREFSVLSNIMKVRHDTAKSAINNVR